MTAKQRQQEMKRRAKTARKNGGRMAFDPVADTVKAMKHKPSPPKGGKGRKLLTAEQRAAKQRIYQQRHLAKVAGTTPPPLPEANAA